MGDTAEAYQGQCQLETDLMLDPELAVWYPAGLPAHSTQCRWASSSVSPSERHWSAPLQTPCYWERLTMYSPVLSTCHSQLPHWWEPWVSHHIKKQPLTAAAYRFYTSSLSNSNVRVICWLPFFSTQRLPQNKETHIFKSESLPDLLGLGVGLFQKTPWEIVVGNWNPEVSGHKPQV